MKLFEKPWLEIVKFYAEDIVTESPTFGTDDIDPGINENEGVE